jgi:Fe-S cluster assembly iron-binding protein IscA
MMVNVTRKAAALLKAAKAAEGAVADAGIRIRQGMVANEAKSVIAFAITEDPASGDEEFEQGGLRFFVEESLVEQLNGRTLDVIDTSQSFELVWR